MSTRKKMYIIYILSILMIIFILAPILMITISTVKAETGSSNVEVVTDQTKKEELLGIHNNKGVGILGIAEKFSVLTFEDLTLENADIEGRVAVGGALKATTDYEYQIGWKNEDEKSADIILGDGPIENIALNHGADDKGNVFEDKKTVAVSSKASNMNWSDYTEEELSNNFVESDLIDFDTEYERLKQVSKDLGDLEVNGNISYPSNKEQLIIVDDYLSSTSYHHFNQVTIFSGTDEELNVFSLSVDEWNSIDGSIAFDVPVRSKIIINITGKSNVELSDKFGFFFLVDDEFLATKNLNEQDLGYIDYEGDLIRDSEENPKIFARVTPGQMTVSSTNNIYINNEFGYEYAQRMLFNIIESDSFSFTGEAYNSACFVGTIMAMNANGADISKMYHGYLQGSLICKSYSGKIQIGYAPFIYNPTNGKVQINIDKIDNETQESIKGAELSLYKLNINENGEILYNDKVESWTSNTNSRSITLDCGKYVLKENSSANNYENVSENYIVFEVKKIAYLNYGKLDYKTSIILENSEDNKSIHIEEHTADLDYFPATWNNLYYAHSSIRGGLIGSGRRVSELEFTVDSVDKSIQGENLYVLVSDTNGRICQHEGTYVGNLDWVEFKRWTKTEIGGTIKTKIPLIKYFYPFRDARGYEWQDDSKVSFKPHFYIENEDGATEVTDLVTISNVKAHWYVGKENIITPEYVSKSDSFEENGKEYNYFTVDEKSNTIKVANKHIKTTIEITKQDANSTTTLLEGATYEIQDSEGNTIKNSEGKNLTFEATDTNGKSTLENLRLGAGTYYLVEIKAPAGYKLSDEKIPFIVKAHTSETIRETVKDEKIKVSIEKQDEYGNKLSGANLQILDKDKKVITTWTSENSIKEIEGLSPEEYTLHENYAPTGFIKAEDIQFTVTDKGKVIIDGKEVEKIVMVDKTLKRTINITKQNNNGEILEGAELKLVEADTGTEIETWTTESTKHEINGKLQAGKTYKLIETKAPAGYVTAKDLEFTVEDNNEVQEITMIDNETKVQISKQDITTGEEIVGAELTLETLDGEIVDKWTSTNKPHEIKGTLVAGQSYKLTEITAPDGYIKAESVTFKVEDTEEVQKVEMEDDYTKVKIEKVDENGKYLEGAELQIIDKNGNVVEKWTSGDKAYEINRKLIAGKSYTLQEIVAPKGYKRAEDIAFNVSGNGEIDTIKITNIKEDANIIEEIKNNEVVRNIIQGALPKTGDAIVIYLAIIVCSLICILVVIIKEIYKQRKS